MLIKNRIRLILTILTIAGGILRFYGLPWGSPYFFHPDERNIASAISNLHFPDQLNPHFFAYGSFPIYLTYLIASLLSLVSGRNLNHFESYILIGRAVSASLSTLMIPLVYLIAKELLNPKSDLRPSSSRPDLSTSSSRPRGRESSFLLSLPSVFITFSPGLIQFAHFSTFETILTFQYLLITYLALRIWRSGNLKHYLSLGLILGLSIATKITSLAAIPVLLLAHLFKNSRFINPVPSYSLRANTLMIYIIKVLEPFLVLLEPRLLLTLFVTAFVAFGTSPFNLLDYPAFRGALNYEGGVATGSLPVFYTASFIKTTPLFYQLFHVFPPLIGWPLTILGFLSFFILTLFILKKLLVDRKLMESHRQTLVFLALPFLYLAFHAPLYVKWTRYMLSLVPYLIIAFSYITLRFVDQWPRNTKEETQNPKLQPKTKNFGFLLVLLVFLLLLFDSVKQGLSFTQIYLNKDTRIAAAEWASQNLPQDSKILSEVWDLGIVPFNDKFPIENIKLFNFYELDAEPRLWPNPKESVRLTATRQEELNDLLKWADVIVLPSRRIWATRLRLPDQFPNGHNFYQKLFTEELGFVKIASFKIRDESGEETFEVFDHPEVTIFKKL